jgi:hypothetical protein
MTLIKLTQWQSGKPVYVHPDNIAMIQECEAKVYDNFNGTFTEIGERTRIDTKQGQCLLVVESAAEVLGMCPSAAIRTSAVTW